jgi:hypothetical protein
MVMIRWRQERSPHGPCSGFRARVGSGPPTILGRLQFRVGRPAQPPTVICNLLDDETGCVVGERFGSSRFVDDAGDPNAVTAAATIPAMTATERRLWRGSAVR